MRCIVAGGRTYQGTEEDWQLLLRLVKEYNIDEIVSGHARGADAFGERFATETGIDLTIFPANWTAYGKSAGHIRNKRMADYADAVILFPGGPGTANMRKTALKHGLSILYDAASESRFEDIKRYQRQHQRSLKRKTKR